jgi:hypothetical protein
MSLLDELSLKDNVAVEGITADHVWYNADLLTKSMSSWATDFKKLVTVMEDRHKEHLQMIGSLLAERAVLKSELSAFKQKVKE